MKFFQCAVIATTALLPTYLIKFTIAGFPTNVLEILIAICLIATLFSLPSVPFVKLKQIKYPLLFIALFVAAALVSTAISPHPSTSLGILKGWIILPIGLGFCVAAAGLNRRVWRYIVHALVLSGATVALFGISQMEGLDRISSVYDVPNSLALFLSPLIVLAVFSKGKLLKYAALVMGVGLLLTQSVGGIMATIAALFLGSFCMPGNCQRIYIGSLLFLLVLSGSYLSAAGRWEYFAAPFTQEDAVSSLTVRRQLWSVSLDLVRENPLLGIGLGVFEPHYQASLHKRFYEYENNGGVLKPVPEFVFRDPHNWLLSFWLNTGLLGLISFTVINLWLLKGVCLPANKQGGAYFAVAMSLAAMLIFGLTDTIYWKNDLSALYWVLAGLIFAGRSFGRYGVLKVSGELATDSIKYEPGGKR